MATLQGSRSQRAATPADQSQPHAYYSISQAAALLGVSRVTVWRWIRAGHLPVARLGHRTTRIKQADLERLPIQIGPAGAAARRLAMAESLPGLEPDGGAAEHHVQFYESDRFLLDSVAEFVATALRAGDAAIVVATPEHCAGLETALGDAGFDVPALCTTSQFAALDARAMLAGFMRDGAPDKACFDEIVGDLLERASAGRDCWVRVYGEMVALLAADGNYVATVGLEQLWNELQQTREFALLCGYPMDRFGGEALAELLGSVCAEHSHVVPTEEYTALTDPGARLRVVAALQQQARSLEAEVAERKRIEDELRVALAATEAALRSRDEFLATASHELRTPLTALSGQAQLALRRLGREGAPEPKRLEQSLQTIAKQADKLSRLLNQLLDISRVESGKLQLDRERTDLVALVEQGVNVARAVADRHVISWTAQSPVVAEVDQLRFEQVVNNLLDNAIKYSPEGGDVDVVLRLSTPAEIELSVRDHGLGIPPEKRGQIFERFFQAHGDGFRSGMGLGLYIIRQIVEQHGGTIGTEFPMDGGTRFVVRLPVTIG